MIDVSIVLSFLISHWVSDFILQTHWQASNKSKNWLALSSHVATYTVSMGLILTILVLIPFQLDILLFATWVGLNGVLHFITDAITSRISSKLFAKDWHNFFVVVGLDQLIHYVTLIVTFSWFFM